MCSSRGSGSAGYLGAVLCGCLCCVWQRVLQCVTQGERDVLARFYVGVLSWQKFLKVSTIVIGRESVQSL